MFIECEALPEAATSLVCAASVIHSLPLLSLEVVTLPTLSCSGCWGSALTLRYALTCAVLCLSLMFGKFSMYLMASIGVSFVQPRSSTV